MFCFWIDVLYQRNGYGQHKGKRISEFKEPSGQARKPQQIYGKDIKLIGMEKHSPTSRDLLVVPSEENHKKYLPDKVRLKYMPQPEAVSLIRDTWVPVKWRLSGLLTTLAPSPYYQRNQIQPRNRRRAKMPGKIWYKRSENVLITFCMERNNSVIYTMYQYPKEKKKI